MSKFVYVRDKALYEKFMRQNIPPLKQMEAIGPSGQKEKLYIFDSKFVSDSTITFSHEDAGKMVFSDTFYF